MSAHCPNPRLVKRHRSYSVGELAERLHVHKNTLRAWHRAGLAPIDNHKPMVFHGAAVAAFLEARRAKAKHPCPPGHIYCLKCRAPRMPAGDMADYIPLTELSGNLAALCPVCGGMMYRRIRRTDIAARFANLEVTFTQCPLHIRDTSKPCAKSHFKTGAFP
jgi:hypothetical protein